MEEYDITMTPENASHVVGEIFSALLQDKQTKDPMPLRATYTPLSELWGYRLRIEGEHEIKAVKHLLTGETVEIPGVIQDTQAHQTRLDFWVLPGDDNPAVMKPGETVQIHVVGADHTTMASIVLRREPDDSLTTETEHINLTYLPIGEEDSQ